MKIEDQAKLGRPIMLAIVEATDGDDSDAVELAGTLFSFFVDCLAKRHTDPARVRQMAVEGITKRLLQDETKQ